MLSESERYTEDTEMLQTVTSFRKTLHLNQHLYKTLLYSACNQKALTLRLKGCCANPQNLPLQPVPKLEDTICKYLKSVKPLVSECEYTQSCKVFEEFQCQEGPKLQKFLVDRAARQRNWLERWWLETAYLGFRQPVVVYSSPGQTFPQEKFNCDSERICYAANMILGAASYITLIIGDKIPVEKMGKDPLDMEQYKKIFGTCRIPADYMDGMEYNPKSKHIVVVHKNHFFKVKIFDNNYCMLSLKQVIEQLNQIVCQSQEDGPAVGVLSGDFRDSWAQAYKILICDPANRKSVCTIQQSLFLMCLDSCMQHDECDNRQTAAAKQLVHGGGSCYNAGNRWYDKTVQFIVGTDGVVGLCYEHSPAEGQPIAVMVDYVYEFIKCDKAKDIPDMNCVKPIEKLCFNVNTELACAISNAEKNADWLVNNFELCAFTFQDYGKNFIKSQKLSPDSYIQMAFQYTFFKMYNMPAAQYESAAGRKFIGGRTETIRSCSEESVQFACAMLNCNCTNQKKAEALRKAIAAHKDYTVMAVNGLGVDRHLLGLKKAAQAMRMPTPKIYNDVSYTRSTHFRISSSQVATKCAAFMGYGPSADDGYGCCYNPRDDDMMFAISCFADCDDSSAEDFKETLKCCLKHMQEVLCGSQKAKM